MLSHLNYILFSFVFDRFLEAKSKSNYSSFSKNSKIKWHTASSAVLTGDDWEIVVGSSGRFRHGAPSATRSLLKHLEYLLSIFILTSKNVPQYLITQLLTHISSRKRVSLRWKWTAWIWKMSWNLHHLWFNAGRSTWGKNMPR